MAKLGIFLATGFEECEALNVVDVCRRAGLSIDTISITDDKTVVSSHQVPVVADLTLREVDFDALDMIILPGGMPGTKNLEACEPLMQQLDRFYEEKKCISAICAAPSIFGHRGYLKGREAISYPGFESHLEGAKIVKEPVVVSDFITTSRGLGTALDFGFAIVARYCGEEKAKEIAEAIVY
ncbi:MAG: DJ-1/PfpI family protein [Lachnospiraceae bacterium]|nr:DJ-1/PfpI family protein [Lachnospiraceae bacterium]MDD5852768.1 DJ-1/PfpI family protein [Lachnospiraceae bacterium]